jgi:hypothetical protein
LPCFRLQRRFRDKLGYYSQITIDETIDCRYCDLRLRSDCVLFNAFAWNIPGHMLSGAIAYQILQRDNPTRTPAIRSVLERNPWYERRWKSQLEKLPQVERDEMLFMLAARLERITSQ